MENEAVHNVAEEIANRLPNDKQSLLTRIRILTSARTVDNNRRGSRRLSARFPSTELMMSSTFCQYLSRRVARMQTWSARGEMIAAPPSTAQPPTPGSVPSTGTSLIICSVQHNHPTGHWRMRSVSSRLTSGRVSVRTGYGDIPPDCRR